MWPTSPLREQAVDHLLAAAAGVALEGHLVADEDPADLALRHLAARPRRDPHRGPARRPAGGAGRGAQVLRGGDGRVGDLGRAVEVVDVVAEAVHPGDRQLARQRRARERGDPQRGEVVAGERLLRQGEDALDHHRHRRQHVGAAFLDRLQRPLGVEAAAQHHRRGGRQAHHEVEEAPGVEERRRDHHRLAAAEGDLVDQRGDRHQPVGAGALGALRGAGGAGGEDHEARLVGRRLVVGLGAGGDQLLERRLAGLLALVDPADDRARPSRRRPSSRPANSAS